MPTKVMSASRRQRQRPLDHRLAACSISRSSGEEAMAGSGIGKDARLDPVGHGEDDVVEGGRAVGRDVAGQRHHLVLRAFHRRQLLDRRLQRPPRADRHDDRLGRAKPPLDLGGGRLGDAQRGRGRSPDRSAPPRRDRARTATCSRAPRSRQLAIGWSTLTLMSPSDTASDTSRCAVCRETPSLPAIWSWVLPAT